jgi:hypothetical protein
MKNKSTLDLQNMINTNIKNLKNSFLFRELKNSKNQIYSNHKNDKYLDLVLTKFLNFDKMLNLINLLMP